jgi:hypothetical protein
MARITFDHLRLHRAVLEIRYPNGYRYWDICGKCILEIRSRLHDELDFQQLSGGEECILKFKSNPLARASFGFRHLTVSGTYLRNINLFKENGPVIFDIVRQNLEIKHLDRVGFRFWYVYGTKNSGEAEKIVNNLALFNVAAQRFTGFGDKVDSILPSIIVSDGGRKVTITIGAANREGAALERSDPEEEQYSPQSCVLADFDFYQENVDPETINLEQFIHNCQKNVKDNIATLINP